MRKTIFKGLTGLLIPFAAYAAAPTGYGAYQRRLPVSVVSHQTLSDAVRSHGTPAARTPVMDESQLIIAAGSPVRELVIIDSTVPDKAVLLSAARPGVETVVLEAGADALEQTIALLKKYESLDAVHLVSHGEPGAILLGDQRIDKNTLEAKPEFMAALGAATRVGADLLLYACDLAREGAELLEVMQGNSHLDIAASNDLTGASALGGDWSLEVQTGNIEVAQAFSEKALKDFSAVLRPFGTKTFEALTTEVYETNPSIDFGDFAAFITSTQDEILSGTNVGACIDDLYVNMLYQPTSKFYIRSDPSGESFGVSQLILRRANSYNTTSVNIEGFTAIGDTISVVQKNGVSLPAGQGAAVVDLTTGVTGSGSFAEVAKLRITPNDATFCINSIGFTELDSDGNVTAAAGVTEPVGLSTTIDTVGEAVNVFDFRISDGGASDDQPLTVSQLFLSVTGTSTDTERGQITWRLNGPDASNVSGTYNPATDRITFSGLSLSIADGGNETYTVNAYYNNNTSITDGRTVILSIDGDTNLTVGSGGTQMGSTSPVNNGTGTTLDVVATQLVFTTQPGGSVSGAALTQQPVVAARDAFGNTDRDFTETITLSEGSAGTLSNSTQAASNGVATFTNLIYSATADQQSFTLTANDQDGVGSNLPTADSNSVISNVVATKLLFTTQPVPTTITSGVATGFTTVPVVSAMDANNIVDTGYATSIVLSVTDPNDGIVDGAVNSLTGTGDTDGSGTTVTLTPSSGVATYTGLQLTYTASGGSNTIALRGTSGGLTAATSSHITAASTPVVTAGNISISGATGAGGVYKIGDTVTAAWNNTAGGDNNAGITGVTVNFSEFGGGTAVAATESSGTWTASYQIVAGSINAANRNVSVTATNASGPATTEDNANATVDNIRPTAGIVVSDTNLIAGETSLVTITFNEAVTGFTNADLTIANGGLSAVSSSDGGITWTATFTPTASIVDATNVITLANTGVQDAAGNAGAGTTDSNNYAIDTVRPTAIIVVDDTNLLAGETSLVTVTFSEAVTGFTNADLTIPNGGLSAVSSSDGGITWTATFTPTASIVDATNVITLDNTDVQDAAGNAGTGTTDSNNYAINTVRPTASIVVSDTLLLAGETSQVTITFSEAVSGFATGDMTAANGSLSGLSTMDGGITWTATLTPTAGVNDATNVITLNNSGVVNAAGNAGSGTTDSNNYAIDTDAPTVSSVSLPANGTYGDGEHLNFTVTYDETVTVDTSGGTPRLSLTVGSTTRFANYQSGTGTDALVFCYTVQAGDNDTNGIALDNTLQPNGGTLRDSSANNASTNLGTINSLAGVLVDTQAPVVASNGLSVGEGLSAVIVGGRLSATDNISSSTAVVFTVTAVPVNGVLQLSGSDLSNNDTFTQDDINNNRVSYQHDGSATAGDSFDFNVRDAVDNTATGTFNITIAPPEEPTIIAPVDMDIDATGLFTTVTLRQLLGLAANASDAAVEQARLALASDVADGGNCCNPTALGLSNGLIRLRPGLHTITWRATDSNGNTAEDTQIVNVRPLVSFAKDQSGVEGGQVVLRVILNGESPVYPLDVPYEIDIAESSADDNDHDLVDGQVQFTAGQTERFVIISLTGGDAAESDEVLVVRLGAGVNAGANDSHRITITEGNLPPVVALSLQQNGVPTSLVTPAGGPVSVTANVYDPNGDPLTYDWSMSDVALIDTDGDATDESFTFDPATLSEGVLRLQVTVSDGTASANAASYFRVVTALPNMGLDAGDADADGIPDYLDTVDASNVLPETAAQTDAYLIECDPGVLCRLGQYALSGENGGARVTGDDLEARDVADDEEHEHVGGVFDFEARLLPVPGQSVRVAIPLQAAIPADAVYRKFQNDQWNTFVEDAANALHSASGEAGYCPPPGDAAWRSGLNPGDLCIQLTIEDGGPNDADGLADGGIADPGSVAAIEADEEVIVYGVRSKVKGGGASSDGAFLLALVLLALLRVRRLGGLCSRSRVLALILALAPLNPAQALDWKALLDDSYIEFGYGQADGSRGRGELIRGLAADGVTADIGTYDVTRSAWQLYAGWEYRERLSVRFGYLDLGDARVAMTASAVSDDALVEAIAENYPVSADGWVLSHRFEYYRDGRFSLALDAGLYFWNSEIALTDLNGRDIAADDEDGTDPVAGIGAHYAFSERFSATLGWQRVFFDDQEVDLASLGGAFHF